MTSSINDIIESINHEINIWFIIQQNQLLQQAIRVRFHCDLYVHWSSFYSFVRHISSIIVRTFHSSFICSTIFFNDCMNIFSLQSKISDENTRVCKSNWRVFIVFVRKSFSIRSSTFHFLLFVRQLFQRLHEYFHYNFFVFLRQIMKYTRLQIKLTRFFRFCSKDFLTWFKFARHEFLRVFFWWYDFDFFFVEIVIHIRKTISEFVN